MARIPKHLNRSNQPSARKRQHARVRAKARQLESEIAAFKRSVKKLLPLSAGAFGGFAVTFLLATHLASSALAVVGYAFLILFVGSICAGLYFYRKISVYRKVIAGILTRPPPA